jgi:competence protein ComFB
VINALEEAVGQAYDELRPVHPEVCGCERCRADVLTYALNQARPRYVVGDPLGSTVTRVTLGRDQAKAELAVIVLDAMQRIARKPHHDGPRHGGPA